MGQTGMVFTLFRSTVSATYSVHTGTQDRKLTEKNKSSNYFRARPVISKFLNDLPGQVNFEGEH